MTATERELIESAQDPEFDVREISEVKLSADVYENGTADYYSITCTDHMGCIVDGKWGIVPKVGDTIKIWGRFGRTIRGMEINGTLLFFKTEEQEQVEHQRAVAKKEAEDAQAWQDDTDNQRTVYESELASLPQVFQDRIKKFRDNNPDFDWKHGPYELSPCVDAVKIAEWVKTQDPKDADEIFEQIKRIEEPEVWKAIGMFDGHSGNTAGMAKRLAYLYLTDPETVVLEHAAISPLLGCDVVGCPHPYYYGRFTPEYYATLKAHEES